MGVEDLVEGLARLLTGIGQRAALDLGAQGEIRLGVQTVPGAVGEMRAVQDLAEEGLLARVLEQSRQSLVGRRRRRGDRQLSGEGSVSGVRGVGHAEGQLGRQEARLVLRPECRGAGGVGQPGRGEALVLEQALQQDLDVRCERPVVGVGVEVPHEGHDGFETVGGVGL
ncbi:hypothetical protein ACIQCR_32975 [Streptomyces sp. NPDC093249]|uniref:hypothetical protein n=1 Tax=Streptomyces sp. NPDC093249 TaxID=3366035 RepID=UPI003826AAEC